MPAEKGLFLVCRKTGRIVGLNRRRWWGKWLFPVMGLAALIWFLIRVIPKPARASYPCQRVAAPIALGGIAYFLSLFGVVSAYRHTRKFFRQSRFALAGVCLVIALVCGAVVIRQHGSRAQASSASNAPIGIARGINPGRVVWSYDPATCLWDGDQDSTHWWDSNMIVQARVDAMLSAALQNLTSTTTDSNAWDALFRSFNVRRGNGNISYAQSPNQTIAIKINQNPCNYDNTNYYALNAVEGAAGNQWSITANPHLILSLVKQMVAAQVQQTNIIVSDPTGLDRGWGGQRTIGDNIYLYVHPQFPNVQFVDGVGLQGRELATWPVTNCIAYPGVYDGEGTDGTMICQQFLNAGFLIDMAIAKDHGDGPTLCFKNLYGAISGQRMGGVMYGTGTPEYYSNFIEPMGHQALGQKIMLFMIDALYGAPGPNADPVKWTMSPFNNAWPCSVFLSQDAVAIDSVGFDFLNTEFGLPVNTDYYLHEAAFVPGTNGQKLSGIVYQPNVGSTQFVGSLGVEEHWNNATSKQYTRNLGTGDGIELVSVQTGVYSLNIISPAGASSFAAGTNLPITALVQANTNPVSQVAFYQGTTLLGVSTNSPYSFTWSKAPSGSYALTAVVTDSMGLTATSAVVNITVSSGPLTWNADPAMIGPQDGGGVWNLTSSNWWNGQTNVLWNNNQMPISTALGAANGPAGTITLGAPITVNNLAFNPAGSGNYTIAGGGYALTLTNTPTISVASNCSPTISAHVTGAGFSLTGGGALTLSGTNTLSGAITINGGTLALTGNNTGSTANCTVAPGTTLQLANANAFTGALALNSGSTLQLRADNNTTFPPASITLDNSSDTYNFDVNFLTDATGRTLSLTNTLTFLDSATQAINVTGNSSYTLALGTIVGTTTGHNPYLVLAINTLAGGAGLTIASFQSGNWSQWLNLQGGGKVTITGNLTNLSDGSSVLYVTGGTTATLQGRSALWASASATADGYKYCVANGALVLDNGNALTNNSSGAGLTFSAFILGAVTNVFTGSGFSAPAGVLINSNNYFSAAVWLGDANFPGGGITNNARNTNYVADGDAGFANSGTFTIGGQNTSGTNTYANPIILGWTANKGKSVTLLATTGGEVDFTGGILHNGTDTTAGVQVGDSMHGGLIKFTGANTYAGGTTVANGTLLVNGSLASGAVTVQSGGALGGTGTINGPVTVQSGGTLSPGAPIGTLTINNSLTLAGNLLVAINKSLSPSNGLVAVSGVLTNAGAGVLTITNLGPALAAGDSFKLFNKPLPNGGALTIAPLVPAMGFGWVNNLAVNGTLGVVTVATNPTNLTASCCNGELTLSWPLNHTGWRLEAQTNPPGGGLGTNWVVVSGSASTNLLNIPVVITNGSVFFRMIYP